jgi:hypothetical protein
MLSMTSGAEWSRRPRAVNAGATAWGARDPPGFVHLTLRQNPGHP